MIKYIYSILRSRSFKKRIALIEPDVYASIEEMRNSFMDQLRYQSPLRCSFKIYNAQGNRDLLRAKVHNVLDEKFDLIMTNGPECTMMAKELSLQRGIYTPILFVNIRNPHHLNLIRSYSQSDNHLTGVVSFDDDYEERCNHLLRLQPDLKKVMVLYHPFEQGHAKEQTQMTAFLNNRGCEVIEVPIFSKEELVQEVEKALQNNRPDVIVGLRNSSVMAGMPALIALAERHHIPVFACDLGSVALGAAFGCGSLESKIGAEAAYRAYKILFDGWQPQYTPTAFIKEPYQLCLNSTSMPKQGLVINQADLLWFRDQHGRII